MTGDPRPPSTSGPFPDALIAATTGDAAIGLDHLPRPSPWPHFAGCSIAELYDLAGPVLHLPRYPAYRPGEPRHGDFDYFYLRSARYRSCQAARFLLFGGRFTTLADPAAVDLRADLSGFWSGYFREHFPGDSGGVLRYRGAAGYRTAIAALPGHRVVSPHPFDSSHVPADRYYLADPGLVVRLNDKGCMDRLTASTLPAEVIAPGDLLHGDWRDRWPLPFVVKLTEPSGGGDGVVLCRDEADLRRADQRFAGRQVRVERWAEGIRHNFNVQFRVAADGAIEYVGGSVQRVRDGRYRGNVIDLQWVPPPAVAAVCDEVVRAAAALGWFGVCGLDLIEDETGRVYLIDPNFRLNGSTPFLFTSDYLATQHRIPQLTTGYFSYPGTPRELFDRFRRDIHRRRLLPVGAHYDPARDGTTRLYAALVSDGDPEENAALAAKLASKSLIAGISL